MWLDAAPGTLRSRFKKALKVFKFTLARSQTHYQVIFEPKRFAYQVGFALILDQNAGIFNCGFKSQVCCEGADYKLTPSTTDDTDFFLFISGFPIQGIYRFSLTETREGSFIDFVNNLS